ncbi:VQ motif-containing protein 22-like [Hibiscus syriacus]|uniref:VQ motif-containing protein 22-like n=1 Tax=Hibiscus syriacus TaxID=106335 RepID=UPI0019244AE4|nr:VQ motif-containing protein 22-like [Hibiscus syriacus]
MRETMSSWPQFYDQNLSNQDLSNGVSVITSESVFGDQGSDPSGFVKTPTITTSTAPANSLGSGLGGGSSGGHLSPEGRVGKSARRRSRASRRTPTTLLNTDTTNFRAMVQQFTGGPSAPFAAGGSHPSGANFGFGFGTRQSHVNPNNTLVLPPTGFQLQYQQQQQQNQLLHHHPQNQPFIFSLNRSDNNNPGTREVFFQRLGGGGGNQRATVEGGGGVSQGLVGEGVSTQVPGSRTSASSNENRVMF